MSKLDRGAWHRPLVSIVVTHYNYSDHVEDALLSILDQSHQNWECVIVDDASTSEHRTRLKEIVTGIACSKIRIIENSENIGQVPSFFVGVGKTSGDFVALLDPDDRYGETFLEETINAHVDDTFLCPAVATDQYTLTERGITTGTHMGHLGLRRVELEKGNSGALVRNSSSAAAELIFFPPWWNNWFWSSTSAIVFRRSALKYLRPRRPLAYRRAADSYLASGAHMLGGTLFLWKPLIYRGLHSRNSWITDDLFSMNQSKQRIGTEQWYPTCRRDVVEAMFHNGVRDVFEPEYLASILKNHFPEHELALLRSASKSVAELIPPAPNGSIELAKKRNKSFISRAWRNVRKQGIRRLKFVAARLGSTPRR